MQDIIKILRYIITYTFDYFGCLVGWYYRSRSFVQYTLTKFMDNILNFIRV